MGTFTDKVMGVKTEQLLKEQLKNAVLKYNSDEEDSIREILDKKKGHILSFNKPNGELIIGKLHGYSIVYTSQTTFEVTLDIREEA